MGCGIADAELRTDQCHLLQQVGEVDHRIIGIFPVIGIHVLAEERNLLIAGLKDLAGFPDDGLGVAGTFGASGIRDDTVGTDIVAAAHDRNEGGYAVLVDPDRADVAVGLFMGKEDIDLRTVRSHVTQQLRKGPVGIRAGDQVYLPAVQQGILETLRHAADDADDHVRTGFFLLAEHLDPPPDPLFGIIPYREGIGQDHIGLVHVFRPHIPLVRQDGEDHFRVIHIHLAAIGFNIQFLCSHVFGTALDFKPRGKGSIFQGISVSLPFRKHLI